MTQAKPPVKASNFIFMPLGIKTLGLQGENARAFIKELSSPLINSVTTQSTNQLSDSARGSVKTTVYFFPAHQQAEFVYSYDAMYSFSPPSHLMWLWIDTLFLS